MMIVIAIRLLRLEIGGIIVEMASQVRKGERTRGYKRGARKLQ